MKRRHITPLSNRLYVVLGLLPGDRVWITEADLAAAAKDRGLPLRNGQIPGIRQLRSRGFALDSWQTKPVRWTRTPKGTKALQDHIAATASAATDTGRHHP